MKRRKRKKEKKSGEKIIGLCKLCHYTKELQNSHIISKFAFKVLKNHDAQYVSVSLHPNSSVQRGQKEYQEPLLCHGCDQKIGNSEQYARNLLCDPKERKRLNIKTDETIEERRFTGINYNAFKLFQLSILWRASIASQQFFSKIKLTPQRNEALRQMLYTQNPCPPNEYGCEIIEYYDDMRVLPTGKAGTLTSFIFPPFWEPIEPTVSMDTLKYVFLFAGYIWHFYVPSPKMPDNIRRHFLTQGGNLVISKQCMWDVHWLKDPLKNAVQGGQTFN